SSQPSAIRQPGRRARSLSRGPVYSSLARRVGVPRFGRWLSAVSRTGEPNAFDRPVGVADVRDAGGEPGRVLVLADIDELPVLLQRLDEQPRLLVLAAVGIGGHHGLLASGGEG